MKHSIYNFTDANAISAEGYVHPQCGRLVTLTQHSASLSLIFSMRPEQARHLAAALIAEADALDALPEAA